MAITVNQGRENQFSVRPPEELAAQLLDFLKNNVSCTITNALSHNGNIEGQITDSNLSARGIAGMIAASLDYEIESDSALHAEWTLLSKEEMKHYEHYGI
ncbi:MAG: hypothetical protein K0R57_3349 [Paenibacillaceae bacterium]|jgi:hypothetical protein|nr:hypothetical protein [Paenibacillaceae bacterium]